MVWFLANHIAQIYDLSQNLDLSIIKNSSPSLISLE